MADTSTSVGWMVIIRTSTIPVLNMKIAANFLIGLGLAMLMGYGVIGIRTGSGFIHEPFVMLPASVVLLLGGLTARFILPRM